MPIASVCIHSGGGSALHLAMALPGSCLSGSGVQTWGEVRVSPSNVVPPQCRASSGVPTAATMLHILCFEMMSGSVQGTLGIVLWYVGLGLLGALSVSMLA